MPIVWLWRSMPLIEPPDPRRYEPKIAHQLLVQNQLASYRHLLASKSEIRSPEPSNANSSLIVPFTSVRLSKLDSQKYSYLPFKFMQLPQPGWWTMCPASGGYRDKYELKLSPAQDKNTHITFYCRGTPFVDNFPIYEILKEPPHSLSQEEQKSIELRIEPGRKAYTKLLNAKQVLCKEWIEGGAMYYQVEFNHNPDSTKPFIPALITFQAKPAQYKRYIQQIKACLQTIKWNDKVTIVP